MDDLPPPPPAPKPIVTPVADTSPGDEIGVEDVVRISSNLVSVPASVVDSQGRAIIDLKLEDFELRVDGQPRPITDLNRSEVPVTLALLFDNSQSLTAAREFEKQAAVRFFRSVIRPIDRAAIYSVATDVVLTQPLTNSVQALVRTIEHFGKPEGATRLLDAIAEAAAYLRPYPGRKVIVIVSDGEDTLSDLDFDATLRRVLAADCQVYAVQTKQIEYAMLTGETGNANVRALAAERRMQDLTMHTGGAVYTPLRTNDLDAAFTQISADLAQQYVLSYYPTDDRSDGRFRILSVRVATRSNMRVRARRGYYPRRPNERGVYNLPTLITGESAVRYADPAVGSDQSPIDSSRSQSVSSIASNSAPKISSSVPARSRRVGPSDVADEPDTSSNVVTVAGLGGPVYKGTTPTGNAGETTSPPSKTETKHEAKPESKSESKSETTRPEIKPVPKAETKGTPDPARASTVKSPDSGSSQSSKAPPISKPISGGILNGRATSLPKPTYPPNARTLRAFGVVTVEVLLDEQGKVISAKAVDGHPSLRQAAVAAAREARFSPTTISGKPVQVTGVISYNFILAQ